MSDDRADYLDGQLLIAMPTMGDPRFERSVIFMCAHSDQGAMGLIVNKVAQEISFDDLVEQLDVQASASPRHIPVYVGGPVETGRGFVLHSMDFFSEGSTLRVNEDVGLTATVDILRAMATGRGPGQALLALGYSGWAPGQLDQEIQSNGWLHTEFDSEIVFDRDIDSKWDRAVAKLGIDPSFLSADAGHA